jgi:hypothetical protein
MLLFALGCFIFTVLVVGGLAAVAISADALADLVQWRSAVRAERKAQRAEDERALREWLSRR